MRKQVITLLCATLWLSLSYAQQNVVSDSRSKALKKMPNNTEKVYELNNIASELWQNWYLDSALVYANEAKELALKLNDNAGLKYADMNLGDIYMDLGDYPIALENYLDALLINYQLADKFGLAASFSKIGNVYIEQGNYPEALSTFFISLRIHQQMEDQLSMAIDYSSIGSVYNLQENNEMALDYYLKALAIDAKIGDDASLASDLGLIGSVYIAEGNYSEALYYFTDALTLDEKMGDQYGIAYDLMCLADIYSGQGKPTEALEYYKKSLRISQELGYKNWIAANYSSIGDIYLRQNEYKLATAFIDSSQTLASTIGANDVMRLNFSSLYLLDSVNGNFKSAFENYKNYISYRDYLVNEENNEKIIQAQMNFDFTQQQLAEQAEQDKKDAIAETENQKQKIIRNGFIIGFILMLLLVFFVFRSYRQKKQANLIISQQKQEVEDQKAIVDAKNKDILDSINYAERIQRSFLATTDLLNKNLTDYFVFFQPKEVVSGDFYWAGLLTNNNFALVNADSTGHGVPGAIMSILNISSLEKAVEKGLTHPADIFNDTRLTIIERLKKDGSPDGGKDGMDASLISINANKTKMYYVAAQNPIWLVRDGEFIEIKPEKMPVGKHDNDSSPFQGGECDLQKGDLIYTITDGFQDQFGGPKGKKFMVKKLREFILSISNLPMQEQHNLLSDAFSEWKGNLEQVDDVCVIGIRI